MADNLCRDSVESNVENDDDEIQEIEEQVYELTVDTLQITDVHNYRTQCAIRECDKNLSWTDSRIVSVQEEQKTCDLCPRTVNCKVNSEQQRLFSSSTDIPKQETFECTYNQDESMTVMESSSTQQLQVSDLKNNHLKYNEPQNIKTELASLDFNSSNPLKEDEQKSTENNYLGDGIKPQTTPLRFKANELDMENADTYGKSSTNVPLSQPPYNSEVSQEEIAQTDINSTTNILISKEIKSSQFSFQNTKENKDQYVDNSVKALNEDLEVFEDATTCFTTQTDNIKRNEIINCEEFSKDTPVLICVQDEAVKNCEVDPSVKDEKSLNSSMSGEFVFTLQNQKENELNSCQIKSSGNLLEEEVTMKDVSMTFTGGIIDASVTLGGEIASDITQESLNYEEFRNTTCPNSVNTSNNLAFPVSKPTSPLQESFSENELLKTAANEFVEHDVLNNSSEIKSSGSPLDEEVTMKDVSMNMSMTFTGGIIDASMTLGGEIASDITQESLNYEEFRNTTCPNSVNTSDNLAFPVSKPTSPLQESFSENELLKTAANEFVEHDVLNNSSEIKSSGSPLEEEVTMKDVSMNMPMTFTGGIIDASMTLGGEIASDIIQESLNYEEFRNTTCPNSVNTSDNLAFPVSKPTSPLQESFSENELGLLKTVANEFVEHDVLNNSSEIKSSGSPLEEEVTMKDVSMNMPMTFTGGIIDASMTLGGEIASDITQESLNDEEFRNTTCPNSVNTSDNLAFPVSKPTSPLQESFSENELLKTAANEFVEHDVLNNSSEIKSSGCPLEEEVTMKDVSMNMSMTFTGGIIDASMTLGGEIASDITQESLNDEEFRNTTCPNSVSTSDNLAFPVSKPTSPLQESFSENELLKTAANEFVEHDVLNNSSEIKSSGCPLEEEVTMKDVSMNMPMTFTDGIIDASMTLGGEIASDITQESLNDEEFRNTTCPYSVNTSDNLAFPVSKPTSPLQESFSENELLKTAANEFVEHDVLNNSSEIKSSGSPLDEEVTMKDVSMNMSMTFTGGIIDASMTLGGEIASDITQESLNYEEFRNTTCPNSVNTSDNLAFPVSKPTSPLQESFSENELLKTAANEFVEHDVLNNSSEIKSSGSPLEEEVTMKDVSMNMPMTFIGGIIDASMTLGGEIASDIIQESLNYEEFRNTTCPNSVNTSDNLAFPVSKPTSPLQESFSENELGLLKTAANEFVEHDVLNNSSEIKSSGSPLDEEVTMKDVSMNMPMTFTGGIIDASMTLGGEIASDITQESLNYEEFRNTTCPNSVNTSDNLAFPVSKPTSPLQESFSENELLKTAANEFVEHDVLNNSSEIKSSGSPLEEEVTMKDVSMNMPMTFTGGIIDASMTLGGEIASDIIQESLNYEEFRNTTCPNSVNTSDNLAFPVSKPTSPLQESFSENELGLLKTVANEFVEHDVLNNSSEIKSSGSPLEEEVTMKDVSMNMPMTFTGGIIDASMTLGGEIASDITQESLNDEEFRNTTCPNSVNTSDNLAFPVSKPTSPLQESFSENELLKTAANEFVEHDVLNNSSEIKSSGCPLEEEVTMKDVSMNMSMTLGGEIASDITQESLNDEEFRNTTCPNSVSTSDNLAFPVSKPTSPLQESFSENELLKTAANEFVEHDVLNNSSEIKSSGCPLEEEVTMKDVSMNMPMTFTDGIIDASMTLGGEIASDITQESLNDEEFRNTTCPYSVNTSDNLAFPVSKPTSPLQESFSENELLKTAANEFVEHDVLNNSSEIKSSGSPLDEEVTMKDVSMNMSMTFTGGIIDASMTLGGEIASDITQESLNYEEFRNTTCPNSVNTSDNLAFPVSKPTSPLQESFSENELLKTAANEFVEHDVLNNSSEIKSSGSPLEEEVTMKDVSMNMPMTFIGGIIDASMTLGGEIASDIIQESLNYEEFRNTTCPNSVNTSDNLAFPVSKPTSPLQESFSENELGLLKTAANEFVEHDVLNNSSEIKSSGSPLDEEVTMKDVSMNMPMTFTGGIIDASMTLGGEIASDISNIESVSDVLCQDKSSQDNILIQDMPDFITSTITETNEFTTYLDQKMCDALYMPVCNTNENSNPTCENGFQSFMEITIGNTNPIMFEQTNTTYSYNHTNQQPTIGLKEKPSVHKEKIEENDCTENKLTDSVILMELKKSNFDSQNDKNRDHMQDCNSLSFSSNSSSHEIMQQSMSDYVTNRSFNLAIPDCDSDLNSNSNHDDELRQQCERQVNNVLLMKWPAHFHYQLNDLREQNRLLLDQLESLKQKDLCISNLKQENLELIDKLQEVKKLHESQTIILENLKIENREFAEMFNVNYEGKQLIADLEEENNKLKGKNEEFKIQNTSLKGENELIWNELKKDIQKLEKLKLENECLAKSLEEKDTDICNLRSDRKKLKSLFVTANDKLNALESENEYLKTLTQHSDTETDKEKVLSQDMIVLKEENEQLVSKIKLLEDHVKSFDEDSSLLMGDLTSLGETISSLLTDKQLLLEQLAILADDNEKLTQLNNEKQYLVVQHISDIESLVSKLQEENISFSLQLKNATENNLQILELEELVRGLEDHVSSLNEELMSEVIKNDLLLIMKDDLEGQIIEINREKSCLQNSVSILKHNLLTENEQLKNELNTTQEAINGLNDQITDLNENLKNGAAEYQSIASKNELLESKINEISEDKLQLQHLVSELQHNLMDVQTHSNLAKEQLSELIRNKEQTLLEEKQILVSENEQLKHEIKSTQEIICELESRVVSLNDELKEENAKQQALMTTQEHLQKQILEISEEKSCLEYSLSALEQNLMDVQTQSNLAKEQLSELIRDKEQTLLEEKQILVSENEQLKHEIKCTQEIICKLESRVVSLNDELKEENAKQQALMTTQEHLQKQILEISEEKSCLEYSLSALEQNLMDVQTQSNLAKEQLSELIKNKEQILLEEKQNLYNILESNKDLEQKYTMLNEAKMELENKLETALIKENHIVNFEEKNKNLSENLHTLVCNENTIQVLHNDKLDLELQIKNLLDSVDRLLNDKKEMEICVKDSSALRFTMLQELQSLTGGNLTNEFNSCPIINVYQKLMSEFLIKEKEVIFSLQSECESKANSKEVQIGKLHDILEEKDMLNSKLEGEIEKLKIELGQHNTTIVNLENELLTVKNELVMKGNEIAQVKDELLLAKDEKESIFRELNNQHHTDTVMELEDKVNFLNNEINCKTNEIFDLKTEIIQLKSVEVGLVKRVDSDSQMLNQQQEKIQELTSKLEHNEELFSEMNMELQRKGQEFNGLNKDLVTLLEEKKECVERIEELSLSKNKLSVIESEIIFIVQCLNSLNDDSNMSEALLKCLNNSQSLAEVIKLIAFKHTSVMDKFESIHSDLKSELAKQVELCRTLDTQMNCLNEELKSHKMLYDEDILQLKEEIAAKDTAITDLSEVNSKLKQEYDNIVKKISETEGETKGLRELQEEVQTLKQDNRNLVEASRKFNVFKEVNKKLTLEIEDLSRSIKFEKQTNAELKSKYEAANYQLADLRKEKFSLEDKVEVLESKLLNHDIISSIKIAFPCNINTVDKQVTFINEKLTELDKIKDQLEVLQEEHNNLKHEHDKSNKYIKRQEEKVAKILKRELDLKKQVMSSTKNFASEHKILEDLKSQIFALFPNQDSSLDEVLVKVKELVDVGKGLQQGSLAEVEELKRLLEEAKQDNKDLDNECEIMHKHIKVQEELLASVLKREEELKNLNSCLKTQVSTVSVSAPIADLSELLMLFPEKPSTLSEALELVRNSIIENGSLKEKITETQEECASMDKECEDMYKAYQDKRKELEDVLKREAKLIADTKFKEDEIEGNVKALSEELQEARLRLTTNPSQSGDCQCEVLKSRLAELKLDVVNKEAKITALELQFEADNFPIKKKVADLEKSLDQAKQKISELKAEVRRYQGQMHEVTVGLRMECEKCRQSMAVQEESSAQTSATVVGDEAVLTQKDKEISILKALCRSRKKRITELEQDSGTKVSRPLRSALKEGKENSSPS